MAKIFVLIDLNNVSHRSTKFVTLFADFF